MVIVLPFVALVLAGALAAKFNASQASAGGGAAPSAGLVSQGDFDRIPGAIANADMGARMLFRKGGLDWTGTVVAWAPPEDESYWAEVRIDTGDPSGLNVGRIIRLARDQMIDLDQVGVAGVFARW